MEAKTSNDDQRVDPETLKVALYSLYSTHGYTKDQAKKIVETLIEKALSDSTVMAQVRTIVNDKVEAKTKENPKREESTRSSGVQKSNFYTI